MRATGGKSGKNGGLRRFLRAPVISAACILASALVAPTVVEAFSNGNESLPVSLAARGGLGSFTPASVDPRLVAQVSIRALTHGRLFQFTPAGMENRPDRAVTVAVRVPAGRGGLVGARGMMNDPQTGFASVRIAPAVYNLGLARGYQSFAPQVAVQIHDLAHDGNELRRFSLASTVSDQSALSSRLVAGAAADDHVTLGRLPRTPGGQADAQQGTGGSYRLIGNFDVTGGQRYSADRDRLRPLTDQRQDSQALYVGTQFRF
jgi:hypothetical protein